MVASNNTSLPTAIIRLFPRAGQNTYPIELTLSDGVIFPRGEITIEQQLLLSLDLNKDAYGATLGKAVFSEEGIGNYYRQALAAYKSHINIRLVLDDNDLYSLCWERLQHPIEGNWRPISLTGSTPFARLVPAQGWTDPTPINNRPLRVLVAIISPPNLPVYGLDPIDPTESAMLISLFNSMDGIEVTFLFSSDNYSPSLAELDLTLAKGYDVLHLVCHGSRNGDGTFLFIEPHAGGKLGVMGSEIIASLRALNHCPRLVCLIACESAARGTCDAFTPLGPALVQDGGVATVLAMRERIGVDSARELTNQFYSRLLVHGRPDLALTEARSFIRWRWDWSSPVLFTRLIDHQLLATDQASKLAHALADPEKSLVDALLACECIINRDDRQQVIMQIRRSDPTFDVRHSTSERIAVHNLVVACRKRPERLSLLITAVQNFEGETEAVELMQDAVKQLIADI